MGRTSIFKKEGEQMEVRFYKFTKKENSTMIPTTPFVIFDCIIKNDSAIINPTIEIVNAMTENPHEWNYCYIPDFGRYYWVSEWSWSNRKWIASLNVDVLATYKTEIGNFDGYILRSAYQFDGDIVDTFYPMKSTPQLNVSNWTSPWKYYPGQTSISVNAGTFVLGIAGSGSYGSLSYYAMDVPSLSLFMTGLTTSYVTTGNLFKEEDASWALQRAMVDPFQYIKSCIWYPIELNEFADFGTDVSNINVGGINITAGAFKLLTDVQYYHGTHTVTTTAHPQATTRGSFLNSGQYSHRQIFLPPFGLFTIESEKLIANRNVVLDWYIDFITGTGFLDVSIANQKEMRIDAQVGVSIQLSQIYRDVFSAELSKMTHATEFASSAMRMDVGGAISSAVSGIASYASIMRPRLDSFGSNGGFASLEGEPGLYEQFYLLTDDDNSHHGRPLCVHGQLSNYPGYLLILNGDVEAVATAEELQQIKTYLEGGFYYE